MERQSLGENSGSPVQIPFLSWGSLSKGLSLSTREFVKHSATSVSLGVRAQYGSNPNADYMFLCKLSTLFGLPFPHIYDRDNNHTSFVF